MWYAAAVALSVTIGGCGVVTRVAGTDATGGGPTSDTCLAGGYDRVTYAKPMKVPDGEPSGVMIGPLSMPNDGVAMEGVVLRVELSHRSTPDLALRLYYDSDCDGTPEASVTLESYLARRSACVVQERYSCPAGWSGAYYFRDGLYAGADDTNRESPGVPCDPIDHGVGVSFAVFDGMPKGGEFYLAAVDSLPGVAGVIKSWTVFTRQPLLGALR